MKTFSIIVPIYKIEKYIEECIKSVINQDYDDYELILVDDGSPDKSGEICDKYSKKYDNIKVIHKKNGGLSDARNTGIDVAEGKYIIFLDGDDILSNNSLNKIDGILKFNRLDLLVCDFIIYGNVKKYDKMSKKINSISDFFKYSKEIPWSAWRSVYKREVFIKENIKFKKGLIGAEDCDLFVDFYRKSTNVMYTNIIIVEYRDDREGSITNNINYNAIIGEMDVFSEKFYIFLKEQDIILEKYFASKYLNTISTITEIKNKDEINQIYDHINRNKEIFKYVDGLKYKIAKVIWKCFGYYNGNKIINKLKRR